MIQKGWKNVVKIYVMAWSIFAGPVTVLMLQKLTTLAAELFDASIFSNKVWHMVGHDVHNNYTV